MVTAAIKQKHAHKFEVIPDPEKPGKGEESRKIAVCVCGEKRRYIETTDLKNSHYEVIQAGDPNYQDGVSKGIQDDTSAPDTVELHPEPVKKPKGGTAMKERHKYIEAHKDEIIIDLATLGVTAARKKWGISSSGWYTIAKRWGLSTMRYKTDLPLVPQEPVPVSAPAPPKTHRDWGMEALAEAIDEVISYWENIKQNALSNPVKNLTIRYLRNYKAILLEKAREL